jgi:hypothetical protein
MGQIIQFPRNFRSRPAPQAEPEAVRLCLGVASIVALMTAERRQESRAAAPGGPPVGMRDTEVLAGRRSAD